MKSPVTNDKNQLAGKSATDKNNVVENSLHGVSLKNAAVESLKQKTRRSTVRFDVV